MALVAFDAEEEKTGDNIHTVIMLVLFEYDMVQNIDQIIFVTDRGANVQAALYGYARNNCLNHMCNNIVEHASKDIDVLTRKVAKLVRYMKVTGLNTKISELDGKRLKSIVPTRWNTTFDMFDSFLSSYEIICNLVKKPTPKQRLESINYAEVTEVRNYLKLFKQLMVETEGEKEVNCVKTLAFVEEIIAHNKPHPDDHPTVKKMKVYAKKYFEKEIIPDLPKNYEQYVFFFTLNGRACHGLSLSTKILLLKRFLKEFQHIALTKLSIYRQKE